MNRAPTVMIVGVGHARDRMIAGMARSYTGKFIGIK